MSGTLAFDDLARRKYLSLETYRKSGIGVRTPVWFAVAPVDSQGASLPELYIYTTADSGKAKRVRRSGASKIAACNAVGTVNGPWIDVYAEIVTGQEASRGMGLINTKYRPWKQILDLSARLFPRHERIVLAIRPV
jgi:PPOX class probable F420-dependent enzyme